MSAGSRLSPIMTPAAASSERSPLAHLLHALNQPLTGLQCSLELAAAGPRTAERYRQSLQQALDLTTRMRVLVEAIRELAEISPTAGQREPLLLDELFAEVSCDLLPVASARNIRLQSICEVPLPVEADPACLHHAVFRFLESALTLTPESGHVRLAATRESGHACILISWSAGPAPEYSPFSRPELGLLVAQAEWQKAGGQSVTMQDANTHACTFRFPLSSFPGLAETRSEIRS